MQSLKDVTKVEKLNQTLENDFLEAAKDPAFAKLISNLKLPKKELIHYTTKFQETCCEVKNCQKCKGLFACKNPLEGHISSPKVVNGKLYFTYIACKYQKALENSRQEKKNHKTLMKDIDTTDKKQLQVIKWIDTFYSEYDFMKPMKGLYLHGSFGSGKTFLLTALFNELEKNKNVHTVIGYFPDVLRDLKEDWENFSYKMKEYMQADILLFDDIGAEKVTEWGRDEILGTILQYRMDHHKTTFFTSNLTIAELEMHLALASNSVDKVKSRRIIERIKQLTEDLALVSENRRV